MAAESRVQQLLDDISEFGCTPEEVCVACPELLPDVRRRWQQMRIVQGKIDAMFPASRPDSDAETSAPWNASAGSLRIPGYEVEALLGRGGMGLVYQARHLRLNRLVALKMLLAGAYAGPHERERFRREAEAAASLRHANIVQVYDVGDHEGCPYFTMELLEGGSLAQALASTPQPARQAAALLTTLAEAVQTAHRERIVHRDLKPANILLTLEGTPKVADFGLARRSDREPALTLSGARIGTSSYMAPEQVIGKAGAIGPAADIYALGALLYEMLTGRPPFRGETAAETERQVIDDDPVSPTRLNPKVPRDLETICLKCLSKEPQRRYASAAALADDLTRFGEGRPIQARPLGWAGRWWRWGRRNPTGAALLATALALIGIASGGATWLVKQRAERRAEAVLRDGELRNEVSTAVAQAASLRQGFHFHQARKLMAQARQLIERAGPNDLRRRVDQAQVDLDLAEGLDAARIQASSLVGGKYNLAGAEPLYASAFAKAGLAQKGDEGDAAAVVQQSPMRAEIVAALDDWASITPDQSRREWLLTVARKADPDPVRDRLRQPILWRDHAKLTQLTRELSGTELSPQLATALGRVSREGGGEAVALLTAAQARFPQDFWLNLELGWELYEAHRLDEAIGYFRAALALCPETNVLQTGLGGATHDKGRTDDAVDQSPQAYGIGPKSALVNNNLGLTLLEKGRTDEAIDHLRLAVRNEPGSAVIHNNLAGALVRKGSADEAIGHLEEAIRLDPRLSAIPHATLAYALQDKGRTDEAIVHLEESIRLDPGSALIHHNLAHSLIDEGRTDEAIVHLEETIRLDPGSSAMPHLDLALCLKANGRLDEAIDHLQQAVRLDDHKSAVAETKLGQALYAAACDTLRDAAGQGSETKRNGEPEQAGKRRQALDCLRSSLDLLARLRKAGNTGGWSPTVWQKDPALASVRDPAALAKLPDAERQRWQRFWADLAALPTADPLGQGRELAARRDWAQAVDGYARAFARAPTDDGHFWFEYAALLQLSGDRPGYVRACSRMIERCGKDGGPRSFLVARACTLAPDAVADGSLPGRLAEKELQASNGQFWSLTELGALAYRDGRFQEAVLFFEKSLRANSKPGAAVLNWLWLALANQRVGKPDDARRWLDKAREWLDQHGDGIPAGAEDELGLHLHNWLEAHVLRREAEALVPSRSPRGGTENRQGGALQK